MTDKCLHCHLMAEIRRWADEHLPKDDAGRSIIGDGLLTGKVLRTLADVIVAEAAPGGMRAALISEASLTFATAMVPRIHEAEPPDHQFIRSAAPADTPKFRH